MSRIAFCISLLLISSAALAQTDRVQSSVEFPNPNGCRVFEMVVDPACPYDQAHAQCQAALDTVRDLNAQLKLDSLKASCKRIHTGNVAARIVEEQLMHSGSWDGFKLVSEINTAQVPDSGMATATAASDSTCLSVSQSLGALGLKVTCEGSLLTVNK